LILSVAGVGLENYWHKPGNKNVRIQNLIRDKICLKG
jgi:hypothetical protein